MSSSDLLNLGNIAVALPVSSINCLPLEEDDTVASFGALSDWTTEQVFIVSPASMVGTGIMTSSALSGCHMFGF